MDGSPLNRLPAELRNIIYKCVLCGSRNVKLEMVPAPKHGYMLRLNSGRKRDDPHMELTRVCKMIPSETIGLFFSQNTFVIFTSASTPLSHSMPSLVQDWLERIGEQAYRIKEIKIYIPRTKLGHLLRYAATSPDGWHSAQWYSRTLVDWFNLVVSNGIPLLICWFIEEIGRIRCPAHDRDSRHIIDVFVDTTYDGNWRALAGVIHAQIDEACNILSGECEEEWEKEWEEEFSPSIRDSLRRLDQKDAHAKAATLLAKLETVHAEGRGNYYWEPHQLRCTPPRG